MLAETPDEIARKDDGNATDLDVCEIVAALLDPNNPSSAEELAEFDELLEDDPDLTEEQRLEFLQAIRLIVRAFVDLAWKDHPIQHALQECGKLAEIDSESDFPSDNMVQSKDRKLTDKYNKAAE